MINEQIYRGSLYGSGQIGHTIVNPDGVVCDCGRYGCLETVASFRFRVAEEELLLPDEQHDDYRWLTPDALLASDNVHANSRAYFLAEKRAGVSGL